MTEVSYSGDNLFHGTSSMRKQTKHKRKQQSGKLILINIFCSWKGRETNIWFSAVVRWQVSGTKDKQSSKLSLWTFLLYLPLQSFPNCLHQTPASGCCLNGPMLMERLASFNLQELMFSRLFLPCRINSDNDQNCFHGILFFQCYHNVLRNIPKW